MDDQASQTLVVLFTDRQTTVRHWMRLILNLRMLEKLPTPVVHQRHVDLGTAGTRLLP